MNLLSILHSLRRLRAFLSLTFPGVGRLALPVREAIDRATARPAVRRAVAGVRESSVGVAVREVFDKYYWEDHSKIASRAGSLPEAALPLLRCVFVLAASLCLLLPLAVRFPFPALPAGTVPGAEGPVALWSVVLWLLASATGWSCLLAGGIATNRLLLLAMLCFCLYFNGAAGAGLGRSSWNWLLVAAAPISVWAVETRPQKSSTGGRIGGAATCLAGCALGGMAAAALTPLSSALGGKILAACTMLGILSGIALHGATRCLPKPRPSTGNSDDEDFDSVTSRHATLWFAAICMLLCAHQLSLVARAGWGAAAAATLTLTSLLSQYLWPLLYFLGAGVLLRAFGRSGDLVGLIGLFLRGRALAAFTATGVLAAAVVAWLPSVVEAPLFPWPAWIVRTAEFVYLNTADWIWKAPLTATAWLWLRWVLLFDIMAIAWLVVRRRFDDRAAGGLLFGTLAAWFFVSEYLLQLGGFARSRNHSALVLGLYAVGILWAVHRTGLKFTAKSTPRWPSFGRLGLFGGVLLFVLLILHARGASHDTRLLDEFFFYFFSGLAGLGIPIYLYSLASRVPGRLPTSLPRLMGAFGIGALLTLATAAADRFVLAGFSAERLLRDLRAAEELIAVAGRPPAQVDPLPALWLAVRGILLLGIFFAVGRVSSRTAAADGRGPMSMLLILAAGLGFASFSGIEASLPILPQRAMLLITPLQKSLMLDTTLAATYVTWGLPALLIGLTCSMRTALPAKCGLFLLAALLHLTVALAWPAREAWIRSAGMLGTAGVALVALFAALVVLVRSRIAYPVPGEAPARGDAVAARPEPYLTPAERRRLTIAVLAVLGLAASAQAFRHRFQDLPLAADGGIIPVPRVWSVDTTGGPGLRLQRGSYAPQPPLLSIDCSSASPAPPPAGFFEDFTRAAAAGLPGFVSLQIESFDRFYRGAKALDFEYAKTFPDGTTVPMSGTRVAVPLKDGNVLTLTLTGVFDDWISMRWDLARIVQELAYRGR